ncbi:hypothetical protein UFOVP381_26 [uncultured Caudovirales phage]|uniref:Uncharacterized protein n=1 Tax=uncultured Caudovirales phage TaxID=2100421 RepID=A0A6J7X2U9_9CAUD|nr:hypothetical protein UFOVP381_26 [uncultured Caudovirales phage]
MRENNNWAYLPDYSSQNHTLKFSRQSRNRDVYHSIKDDESIPPGALFGGIFFAFSLGLLFLSGHVAGF